MTTDQDLAAMVRGAIPNSELHAVDPDVIKTAAARRRARRRVVIVAGVAVAALSISGATLLSGPTPPGADLPAADSPTAAKDSQTPPWMGPGCEGPAIRMIGADGTNFLTMATRVGVEITMPAIVPSDPSTILLEGALVVGRPGTTYGGPSITDPKAPRPPMPATDITQPGRQVARQTLHMGEQAALQVTPTAPGDYPVFFIYRFQSQGDCTKGLANAPGSGVAKVGTIHVS